MSIYIKKAFNTNLTLNSPCNCLFQDPVAVRPWSGVKGGQTPPICPQVSVTSYFTGTDIQIAGQEDCLYLNVYTPRVSTITLTSNRGSYISVLELRR